MEITVVGAGPAGLLVSSRLSNAGYKVNIIEEHKNIGAPVSCSGLIGKDFFQNFKDFDFKNSVKNKIDGAKIFLGEDSFELERKGVSYVVDRCLFDQSISKNLNVSLNEKFVSFKRNNEKIIIKTDKRKFSTDLLIGADGPNSKIRSQGFKFYVKKYVGYQVRIKTNLDLDKFVEVHIEKPFFNWIIPEGEGIFRIGTVSDNPKETIEKFIRKNQIKGKQIDVQAGIIPIGRGEIYKDRVFLLGDAACQVKPLTGGGVYYGALASEFLTRSINTYDYASYSQMCDKIIGKEIRRGLLLRKIYENLNEKELKSIFTFIKSKKQELEEYGQFDEHSKTILSLIKDPKILSFTPILLKTYLRNL